MSRIRGWQIKPGDLALEHLNQEARAYLDGLAASLQSLSQQAGGLVEEVTSLQNELERLNVELEEAAQDLLGIQQRVETLAQEVARLSDRVLALERRPGSQASLSLVELSGTTEVSEPTLVMVLEARLQSAGALKVYADDELIAEYNDVAGTYRFNPVGEGLATATIRVEGPGTALVSLVPLGV
ncbi:hypothetical protein [Thermus phage P23-45]|uniref:Uncharacterized protein n=1 Tax=Thermus virus P23-45 TaxID=2914006 RepID=A7XXF1_BP234|nr:hypothetical protein P23p114 [Thermus phage P23-45]ABU96947.1 hypothetical protein P23p114 [Thermus phage P23-45]UYB98477.1 hypothetical protein [Thermus phage P23-45]